MKNKLLAILTATLLVVTLIPMFAFPAFAEDSQVGQPLCFTAEEAGSTIQLTKVGSPIELELETSTDGNTWSDYAVGTTITLANKDDKVYFRNKSESDAGFSTTKDDYYKFVMTRKIAASGDVTTLLNKNGTNTLSECCFYELFYGCTGLTSAPELPATTLAYCCYYEMFRGCTGLTSAPVLPATTLEVGCYILMFNGCTNLTVAPELPAKEMKLSCYDGMFGDCTGLTSAPELPATTLAKNCYIHMFTRCIALTKAPALPATELADSCYFKMFEGCLNLETIVFSQITPPIVKTDELTDFVPEGTNIIVPAKSVDDYKIANGWSTYAGRIDGAYFINIADTENGIVTSDKQYVLQNDGEDSKTVTLTVTPNEYYKLTSLKVTDTDGEEVTVTDNKFSMPTSSVNITAKFETVKYKMTKGEKQVIDLANVKDTVFVSEADYSKFKGVMVDEKIIDSEYYIAKSGSTMVTLKSDYLKTLEVGKHEIKILSEDGMATAEFTIVKTTPKEEETPKTDNPNNAVLWELIALIGLAGIAGIVLKVKKSK